MNDHFSSIVVLVRHGAALLDEQWGPDWHKEINLATLNLGSTTACILGQLYGDYGTGKSRLGLTETAEVFAYGFSCATGFDKLTEQWRELINARIIDEPLADWERELLSTPPPDEAEHHAETVTLTRNQLVDLVTRAMDSAPVRGDYSEIGLVYSYLSENNLL